MKYTLILASLIFSVALAGDNTAYLKVDGMKCGYSCSGKVSTVVQNLKGVKDCNVDFEKGMATVVYDDKKIEEKDILESLENKTSYKVTLVEVSNKNKKIDKI